MNIQQLLMTYGGGGGAPISAVIASGVSGSTNLVSAYEWSNTSGFGTKFTNPSPVPTGTTYDNGIGFNGAKNAIAFGGDATNFPVMRWSNSGFGTMYANPSDMTSLKSSGGWAAFNGDDTAIGLTIGSTGLAAWQWTNGVGFGTRYTNGSGGGSTLRSVKWAPNNSYVVSSGSSNPYVRGWSWSNSTGLGTAFANPGSNLSSNSPMVDVSPDSANAMVTSDFSPWVHVWPVNASTGFGTKFANPSTAAFSGGYASGVRWNRAGTAVAISNGYQGSTQRMSAYTWSNGFGTKYANPSTTIGNSLDAFQPIFSENDGALLCPLRNNTASSNPNIWAYAWNNSTGFGTKFADPTSTIGGAAWFSNIVMTV